MPYEFVRCLVCGDPEHGGIGPCPVSMAAMASSLPKLAPSSDMDWRKYYEDKCRSQRKDIEALETRLATATELVRECEWFNDSLSIRCNCCGGRTHKPDCKLAAFLEGCKADNPEQSK